MAIKDLKKILEQVHEFNEFKLEEVNSRHPKYFIWKVPNVKMKDLDIKLRPFRKEHARFDIFINGQYILEKDYTHEHVNNDLRINFKRANFGFEIESDDDIRVEGDIEKI